MAKGKDVQVTVTLECTSCARNSVNRVSTGISRYITQKNRHNTPNQLELIKFCPYCSKHMIDKEIDRVEYLYVTPSRKGTGWHYIYL